TICIGVRLPLVLMNRGGVVESVDLAADVEVRWHAGDNIDSRDERRNAKLPVVVSGKLIAGIVSFDSVKAEARVHNNRGRYHKRIANSGVPVIVALLVADEFLRTVVLIVRAPRSRRFDICFLEAIGSVEVVLAKVMVESGVDYVFDEWLIGLKEEVV